jgi:hypothetical protein
MEECPVLDKNEFMEALDKIDEKNHVIKLFKEFSTESCSVGGKRKRKRTKRKLTGGGSLKKNIQIIIYLIITILVALAGRSSNVEMIREGINMMVNGQCSHLINRAWSFLGMENPVCAIYNKLIDAILKALHGDPVSISMIIGAATATIRAPLLIARTVDTIAGKIEAGVSGTMNRRITNGDDDTITGGKTKRASKRKTKRRNTHKHRK